MNHDDAAYFASSSADGALIVTASSDIVRVWDAASDKLLGKPLHHESKVHIASFSQDGVRIVTASGDTARVYHVLNALGRSTKLHAVNGCRLRKEGDQAQALDEQEPFESLTEVCHLAP